MLWNVVFEFFVKNVFGGRLGGVSYQAILGQVRSNNNFTDLTNVLFGAYIGHDIYGVEFVMPLGNYLSLIATIITIVAILLFCVFIIKKIIGIIFRLFTGSSAF